MSGRRARDREQPDRGRKHSVEHDDNRARAEADKRCEGQSRHLHQRRRVAPQTRGYPGPKFNTFTKGHACSDPSDQKDKWLHNDQRTQNVVRHIRENTELTQRVDVLAEGKRYQAETSKTQPDEKWHKEAGRYSAHIGSFSLR